MGEWKRVPDSPLPSALYATKGRIVFIGIGSSYWAGRFSELLFGENLSILIACHYRVNRNIQLTKTSREYLEY